MCSQSIIWWWPVCICSSILRNNEQKITLTGVESEQFYCESNVFQLHHTSWLEKLNKGKKIRLKILLHFFFIRLTKETCWNLIIFYSSKTSCICQGMEPLNVNLINSVKRSWNTHLWSIKFNRKFLKNYQSLLKISRKVSHPKSKMY